MRRVVPVACLFAAIASPAIAQVTRVSVSTAGVEANGGSGSPSISANGRFVVFASSATNLVADDTNGVMDVFMRDRDTDADGILDEPGQVATTRLSVAAAGAQTNGHSFSPVITPDGRYVAFTSMAANLPGSNSFAQIYRLDRTNGTLIHISERADGAAGTGASGNPAISDNGDVVAFLSLAANLTDDPAPSQRLPSRIYVRQVNADLTIRLVAEEPPVDAFQYSVQPPSISADGTRVSYLVLATPSLGQPLAQFAYVVDVASNTAATVSLPAGSLRAPMSADGTALVIGGRGTLENEIVRRVLATGAETSPVATIPSGPDYGLTASNTARLTVSVAGRLVDVDFGVATALGFPVASADFSGNDRWLAVASSSSSILPGNADTNNFEDVFVVDLPDFLDADNDTMDDRWETLFAVTDPAADPDADGQTNAQEEDAGTHPNGVVRRFLAEGATGSFFHTSIALANPSLTLSASAVLTFDRGDGTRVRRSIAIPAGRSAVVDAGAVAGLEFSDVSTTVESDRPLGVERSMTWAASGGPIYGSHAETSTAAPSPTWFLAEGSTVVGFDLFYLLQNPQTTVAHTTVRFLLPDGTIVTRTYDLAPGSRTTVYVNEVPGLGETDVSGDITADAPIVVERAMYRGSAGQPFALGTDSMGVPAAATSWFLAEGATGTFFDLYVLIANPGNTDATVQAQFLKPDGSTVQQSYPVRAHSRFSVFVDGIAGLSDTSVATTLTSNVPIVAERAMYWPGGFFDYYEGHSSAGSTTTSLNWVVGAGENGGTNAAQTFVLIANTANTVGEATITVLPDKGFTGTVPTPTVIPLPANSRTTVPISSVTGGFGVLVASTGGAPVQLVVESAVYRTPSGSPTWSAGSNALATPVP